MRSPPILGALLSASVFTLALPGGIDPAAAGGAERFPLEIETTRGAEKIKLVQTGNAVRRKAFFKVYAIASYLEKGVKVASAAELAGADRHKSLHLIFLRRVSGDDMAQTFRNILRRNYPEPEFEEEIKTVMEHFRSGSAQIGDHFWITHIPKVGLHCRRAGKEDLLIRNVAFSKAVWNNYLGEHNVGEDVKEGLTSEL